MYIGHTLMLHELHLNKITLDYHCFSNELQKNLYTMLKYIKFTYDMQCIMHVAVTLLH